MRDASTKQHTAIGHMCLLSARQATLVNGSQAPVAMLKGQTGRSTAASYSKQMLEGMGRKAVCAVGQAFTLVSLPMNFLERTFLDWKVMLEPMADRKPPQLKVASVTEAMATPPTMGNSDNTMGTVGLSPKKMADSNTLKKGSSACNEVASQVSSSVLTMQHEVLYLHECVDE